MKKILCVFLSIVMALSVATVAFAANEEEDKDLAQTLAGKIVDDNFFNAFNGKTLDFPEDFKSNTSYYNSNGTYNVNNIIRDGQLSKVEFLGLNLGQVYSKTDVLDWGHLSVSHADMGTLWGEMNSYISSYLIPAYTNEDRLCNARNATAIANVIGHMLVAGYQDKTITFDTSFVNRKVFYQRISDESGLTDAIINGWLNQSTVGGKTTYTKKPGINYYPLVVGALRVPIYDKDGSGGTMELFDYFTTPSKEYAVPTELGAYIIKTVIETAISEGPIAYLLSVIKYFVDNYTIKTDASGKMEMVEAVAALLKGKGATSSTLKDFQVLLNTLASGSSMQFLPFPAYVYSVTNDTTEQFLYLMIYTNLLGKHLNNQNAVNRLKQKVDANSAINNQDKKYTKSMIDAMFSGDLSGLANNMQHMSEEVLNRLPGTWGWNFGNFFAKFWNFIASFFDGIFRTLKNGINLDMFD